MYRNKYELLLLTLINFTKSVLLASQKLKLPKSTQYS